MAPVTSDICMQLKCPFYIKGAQTTNCNCALAPAGYSMYRRLDTHTMDIRHGHTPRTYITDTHHGHTPQTHITDTHHRHRLDCVQGNTVIGTMSVQ
ncbi:TPA: hypothetical protein ACH3X3_15221 [Trebouxia sp. C0006]